MPNDKHFFIVDPRAKKTEDLLNSFLLAPKLVTLFMPSILNVWNDFISMSKYLHQQPLGHHILSTKVSPKQKTTLCNNISFYAFPNESWGANVPTH